VSFINSRCLLVDMHIHIHSSNIAFSPGCLLLYQCSTEHGSSGSPVLKEVQGDLKVVALHRGGRDASLSNMLGFNCGTLVQEISNHINGFTTDPC